MKKGIRNAIFATCAVITLGLLMPTQAMAAEERTGGGWENRAGKWYYFDEGGEYQTGWQDIDGKRYFFDDHCAMVKGWQFIDGQWYHFSPYGHMHKGWVLINEKWYFFDQNGVMQTGFQTIRGKTYYMDKNGVMQTGWKELDSESYYFSSSGAMTIGWKMIDEKWYHFDTSGRMQRDTWIGPYYVNKEGVWVEQPPRSVQLNVKCIYQKPELPNGCEVTSLDIVLQYMGFPIKKGELSDMYLPQGKIGKTSPYSAFIGNPRNRNSWYCYSPVIVRCANAYLQSVGSDVRAAEITGSSFDALLEEIRQGRPVIFWATIGMGSPQYGRSWNINGTKYEKYYNLHCMVLTGYDLDKNIVYVADPLVGNRTYNLNTCKKRYEQLHSQAVVLK